MIQVLWAIRAFVSWQRDLQKIAAECPLILRVVFLDESQRRR